MLFSLATIWTIAGASQAIAQIDTTTTGLSILQYVTPTTYASQVPTTAISKFSEDAALFYKSYTDIDKFNFNSQLVLAVVESDLPTTAQLTRIANQGSFVVLYLDAQTSLLDEPSSYMSRLSASASPWPAELTSSMMSQMTGIFEGYKSIASKDILNKTPARSPITPGASIDLAATKTGASGTGRATASGTTSSSKAAAVPMATSNAQVIVNAAAAAVGIVGVVML